MCRRVLRSQSKYLIFTGFIGVVLVGLLDKIAEREGSQVTDPSYEHGVQILQQLQQISIDEVMVIIEQNQNFQSEENTTPLEETNEIDFKQYFNQSVFVGDSLVEAFRAYDFLYSSSVVAKVGARLGTAEEEIKRIINLNPQLIFLAYGINDLLVYDTPEKFIEAYKQVIFEIQSALPYATIYVTSIFPVKEEVSEEMPELSLERIQAFNSALKELCDELGNEYLNIAPYVKDEFYEPDGIHVVSRFYPIWMAAVKELIEGDEV